MFGFSYEFVVEAFRTPSWAKKPTLLLDELVLVKTWTLVADVGGSLLIRHVAGGRP
jgi:hypothetical protein